MIRKLLKYDIKATSRYLLPLYLLFIAITIINGFFKPFDVLESVNSFNIQVLVSSIIVIIYFLTMFTLLIGTLVVLIQRFQKNLLGYEGYLSFTLPVKTWQHTLSKLITSIMWILISIFLILLSISIITRVNILDIGHEISLILGEIEMAFDSNTSIIFPLYLFVAAILLVLTIYNSITIGYQFKNHKIVSSFITFFVFYFITQAITLIIGVVYLLITYGSLSNIPASVNVIPNGGLLLVSISIVMIILSLGHYLLMNYLLENKLNLE